ncbi:hypothetical protein Ae168Ps1_3854c [Pseudonocardia sp. Ae168_Ps1]|nr:hypothetical protein Ae150APs1_3831c [Pseudonocardia sp. Ae150A_Ps1]OLL81448.1 hypothetical protein Ae168Ps1_3854c [Pseudonocardia sp. Ae168_Ps1]OLL95543.1 hypothetical protein Ae356Ps1_5440c [Pseudonocardia sp. Ae356_Ps1]
MPASTAAAPAPAHPRNRLRPIAVTMTATLGDRAGGHVSDG